MPSPLLVAIDDLLPIMQRGDLVGFQQTFDRLVTEGRGLSPDELTAAIDGLAKVLAYRPEGVFARLTLVAGAYVQWGGSPLALAANVPTCALMTMELRTMFSRFWPMVGGGRPEPTPDQEPSMTELATLFRTAAADVRLSPPEATEIALAWFDTGHWVRLLTTLMFHREFREAADLLPEIAEIAAALVDSVPNAHWLTGLARVLDDEPIVVIDHVTGRGFRLTMSGVGDNGQLNTLLADRLIGDPADGLLAGERPAPAWVAAATTGPPQLPNDGPTRRRFRLFDGAGGYIYPEGRPADIPLVDGVRIIVLHPPQGNYGWLEGRTYEAMVPTFTLDHIMTVDEADAWRALIAPARENDLFARTKQAEPAFPQS